MVKRINLGFIKLQQIYSHAFGNLIQVLSEFYRLFFPLEPRQMKNTCEYDKCKELHLLVFNSLSEMCLAKTSQTEIPIDFCELFTDQDVYHAMQNIKCKKEKTSLVQSVTVT